MRSLVKLILTLLLASGLVFLLTPGASDVEAAGADSKKVEKLKEPSPFLNPEQELELGLTGKPELGRRPLEVSQAFPQPKLESVRVTLNPQGRVKIVGLPQLKTIYAGKVAGLSQRNEFVFYSIIPELQAYAQEIVKQAKAPHVAIVAMEPSTGRILAIAEKSNTIKDLSLHAGFPAASVFKVVTAAASIERGVYGPNSLVPFRGGTYVLERWNYKPDKRRDRKRMSLSEALGRSCNAVFGRVGLTLNAVTLAGYARAFGFNSNIFFDTDLDESSALIPDDEYELSRTAAGFGEVKLSPIHAAALVSGLANGGLMPRPALIDRIMSPGGEIIYKAKPEILSRLVRPATAQKLIEMMEYTTTIGTSRKEFIKKKRPVMPGIQVAAKTGTLKGMTPEGVNNWFVAVAPAEDPRIAISVIVVNPGSSTTKASQLGRLMLQKFLLGTKGNK